MTERDPYVYEPFAESLPNKIARTLSELTGLDFTALHKGHSSAVPEAALLAGFRHDDNGRQVLAGVMLIGDAVTAEMLRRIPVSALENGRNLSGDLDGSSAYDVVREEIAKLTPLQSADRSDPEAFSRLVAEHYKIWARAVPHPVSAMSAEAKVKAPTVHTWVRDARLRGFLPPARRGKGRAG